VSENCERIRELLAARALGALDGGELALVEAHLRRCPACRELARENEEAAHALPSALAAASPLELPRPLKEKVLEHIGARERTTPLEPTAPRRRWARVGAAFAAVTLAVAALFVVWDSRLDEARSQERELRARLAKLEGLQPTVLEVVDSRRTVRRVLLPPDERSESRAYGKVFTRTDLRDVVAMANRLPQPRAGQAYHLWVTVADRSRLVGVMPVDRQGFALLVFKADRPGPRYANVQVLLQAKGATRPSGKPALVWDTES
jgi:Anti-sigma-K factor rskA/Putative zinc-finger